MDSKLEATPNAAIQQTIGKPDLSDPEKFRNWLDKTIKKPEVSFKTGAHPDGSPLTPDEQLEITKAGLINYVSEMRDLREIGRRNTSDEQLAEHVRDRVIEAGLYEE